MFSFLSKVSSPTRRVYGFTIFHFCFFITSPFIVFLKPVFSNYFSKFAKDGCLRSNTEDTPLCRLNRRPQNLSWSKAPGAVLRDPVVFYSNIPDVAVSDKPWIGFIILRVVVIQIDSSLLSNGNEFRGTYMIEVRKSSEHLFTNWFYGWRCLSTNGADKKSLELPSKWATKKGQSEVENKYGSEYEFLWVPVVDEVDVVSIENHWVARYTLEFLMGMAIMRAIYLYE